MLAEMGSIVEAVNVGNDSLFGVCLTRQNPPRKPLPLEAGMEGFNTGIIPWGQAGRSSTVLADGQFLTPRPGWGRREVLLYRIGVARWCSPALS